MKSTTTKLLFISSIILMFELAQAQIFTPYTILGTTFLSGASPNLFENPYGVSLDAEGKIYVGDHSNHRVSVWTMNGSNVGNSATFGSLGSGTNQFNLPTEIFVSTDGKIFISDFDNHRISVWTHSGSGFMPLATLGGFGTDMNSLKNPIGVKVWNDSKIFIVDRENHRISVWTINGLSFGNLTTFGGIGSLADKLSYPSSLDVRSDGKIYVADQGNHRISVWTMSGNSIGHRTTFGSQGANMDQFSDPTGISVTNEGKIYVTDYSNHRICVWTTNGTSFGSLATFGSQGIDADQFDWPSGISTTQDGKIYVADQNNQRISIWQSCYTPSILIQPVSQTICGGSLATFNLSATGTNLSYTWSNGLSTTNTMSTSMSGIYLVTVNGTCGSVVSNSIINTVSPNTVLISQPTTTATCSGTSASFTVSAIGTNLTYAWSNGLSTTNTMTTSIAGSNAYNVTVSGTCGVAISTTVSLFNLPTTSITTQPQSSIVQPNAFADISVSATGDKLSYLWSSNETISGIVKQVGIYTVTVTGTCGTVVSNAASIVGIAISTASVTGLIFEGGKIPSTFPASATLTGIGFASGITVTINGVTVSVVSVSENAVVVNLTSGIITSNLVRVQVTNQNQTNSEFANLNIAIVNGFETDKKINLINLYPNPTSGFFTIEGFGYSSLTNEIEIYNSQGVLVYSQKLDSGTTTINISLSKGIYLVKVDRELKKLVVE
jgi:hypothetical protein